MRAKNFSERLKRKRRNLMLSPISMAKELGMPTTRYLDYEAGYTNAFVNHLSVMADKLDVSLDWLMRGEENDGLGGENRKTAAQTQKGK